MKSLQHFLHNTKTQGCVMLSMYIAVLCLSMVLVPTAWAQDPPGKEPVGTFPWWQIVTGILAIPTAIIGLLYTYRLSQKTRLETRKLQLDILEKEGKRLPEQPQVVRYQDVRDSPRAVAAGLQDFVIRYILLSLAVLGWSLIERLITPFVSASVSVWISNQSYDIGQSWIAVLVISLVTQITAIGDFILFLTLGIPLLSDITRAVGFQPFSFFRKRRR